MHLKPCVARKEDNYFFALSKYQKKLEEILAQNPDFVQPSFRLNEVRQGYLHIFFLKFPNCGLLSGNAAVLYVLM